MYNSKLILRFYASGAFAGAVLSGFFDHDYVATVALVAWLALFGYDIGTKHKDRIAAYIRKLRS